jgi:hypothetical protein
MPKLLRHALCATVALPMMAGAAEAAIVHRVVNLAIPVNQVGLWLNIETGATSTTSSAPAGWDINLYTSGAYTSGPAAGGANIIFYTGSSNGAGLMRYPGTVSGTPAPQPAGSIIAAFESFGAGTATFGTYDGSWHLNASHVVGVRFVGADGQVRFGWLRVDVGSTSTQRTLVEYAFESTPSTCIAAGATQGQPPTGCGTPPPYDRCDPLRPSIHPAGSTLPLIQLTTTTHQVLGASCEFTIHKANWYRFIPTASGPTTISTCLSVADTSLAILDSCTPTAAVLACNQDLCSPGSGATFDAVAGVPVWVVVGGSTASSGLPAFLPISVAPPSDPCGSIAQVPSGSTVVSVDNARPPLDLRGYCDPGPVLPAILHRANYARWTAPAGGYYAFGACPTSVPVQVAVLTACAEPSTAIACSYDQCLATNGARVGFWATQGTDYVLAFGAGSANITLPDSMTIDVSPEAPPPDPCGADLGVAVLGMQSIRLDFDFPDLPMTGTPCSFTNGQAKLFYPTFLRFEPPVTGTYSMGNCSDTDPNFWGIYDLRLAVMRSCGDVSTLLACDDDGCNGPTPPWTSFIPAIELQAGVPVYIALGGADVAVPGPFAFEITLESARPCPSDISGDGVVDGADLGIMLSSWGSAAADLDGDGTTGGSDLGILLSGWGPC